LGRWGADGEVEIHIERDENDYIVRGYIKPSGHKDMINYEVERDEDGEIERIYLIAPDGSRIALNQPEVISGAYAHLESSILEGLEQTLREAERIDDILGEDEVLDEEDEEDAQPGWSIEYTRGGKFPDLTGGYIITPEGRRIQFVFDRDAEDMNAYTGVHFIGANGRRVDIPNSMDVVDALADENANMLEIFIGKLEEIARHRQVDEDAAEGRGSSAEDKSPLQNYWFTLGTGVLGGVALSMMIGLATGAYRGESFDAETSVDYVVTPAGDLQEVVTKDYKKVKFLVPAETDDPTKDIRYVYDRLVLLERETARLKKDVAKYEEGKEQLVSENDSQKKELQRRHQELIDAQAALDRLTREYETSLGKKEEEAGEELAIVRTQLEGILEKQIEISRRLSESADLGTYFTQGVGRSDVGRFFMPGVRDAIQALLPGDKSEEYRVFRTDDELKIVTSSGKVVPVPMPEHFEAGLKRARTHYQNMSDDLNRYIADNADDKGKVRIPYSGGDIFADIYRAVYKKDAATPQEALDMRRVVAERTSTEAIDALKTRLNKKVPAIRLSLK
ncbi:hypothetical protein KY335_00230, partial [Candidatus Woesearchaeota archaeon]|nr:hypothetical protein [Candidatus Woesearchaeota archaeon]